MNCSFNIRYKPRTTRAFTKTDLTVYDSADNTALNALTVYGKSEVVDGAIVSAGEGWATVDLGSLSWTRSDAGTFLVDIANMKPATTSAERIQGLICARYEISSAGTGWDNLENKHIQKVSQRFGVKDLDYTNATDFKSAMSGVLLCYELADPTQGNTIAVKTDNGTGINGTMATFTTGTPLRGIPDSNVRDVMAWDGSAGTVTKNCGEVDLSSLEWTRRTAGTNPMFYASVPDAKTNAGGIISATVYTKYPNTYASNFGDDYPDKSWCMSSANNQIYFRDDSILTEADFATEMSGVKLVYELATPTTEQLTATENTSIAGLRTFSPTTHAQNNAQIEMTVDYTIRVPTI